MSANAQLTDKMPQFAAIRTSVILPLLQHLRTSGRAEELLSRHGLSKVPLHDIYATVPMDRYVALFEDSARELGEQNLGAKLGRSARPIDIGPIGLLFSLSPSLKIAHARMAEYVAALQGATNVSVFDDGNEFVYSYHLSNPKLWPRRQDAEFTIVATAQITRLCFGNDWCPAEIHFEHEPVGDTALLRRILRAPILYGQADNRIVMSKAEAERIYRPEDRALTAVLERHAADLTPDIDPRQNIAAKVRSVVENHMGQRSIKIGDIAEVLKMSPRTLQRHLSEEGVSLRGIIRDHRKRIAEMYMALGDINKKRIAEILGYADSTVFWRARQGWGRPRD